MDLLLKIAFYSTKKKLLSQNANLVSKRGHVIILLYNVAVLRHTNQIAFHFGSVLWQIYWNFEKLNILRVKARLLLKSLSQHASLIVVAAFYC